MRKQFPACQKMEQQKLEATAASKALLVIINTKSFQKQQQPQFPTEKKKNGEAGASSSTKITTNFGLRPNQYAGERLPQVLACPGMTVWLLCTFKMAAGFRTLSLEQLWRRARMRVLHSALLCVWCVYTSTLLLQRSGQLECTQCAYAMNDWPRHCDLAPSMYRTSMCYDRHYR